jgi:hypothetical protein
MAKKAGPGQFKPGRGRVEQRGGSEANQGFRKRGFFARLVTIIKLAADDMAIIIVESYIGVVPDIVPMYPEFQALEKFIRGLHSQDQDLVQPVGLG